MNKQEYFEQAKQIFLQGFASVEHVKWLAEILEKADKYDFLTREIKE